VVGIRALLAVVAGFARTAQRIGHHLLGRAHGPRHLADRLLREDRQNARAGLAQRFDVARRRETETITEPETRLDTQRLRLRRRHIYSFASDGV
jgi:hypothetical protein